MLIVYGDQVHLHHHPSGYMDDVEVVTYHLYLSILDNVVGKVFPFKKSLQASEFCDPEEPSALKDVAQAFDLPHSCGRFSASLW